MHRICQSVIRSLQIMALICSGSEGALSEDDPSSISPVPFHALLRNAAERAMKAAGSFDDSMWTIAISPDSLKESGLHVISQVLASAGGSVSIADSAPGNRISVEILAYDVTLDSIPVIDDERPGLVRTSSLFASFLLTDGSGKVRFSDVVSESYQDTILRAEGDPGMTLPVRSQDNSFWDRILIPFVVVGAAGIAIFLLFHVRS